MDDNGNASTSSGTDSGSNTPAIGVGNTVWLVVFVLLILTFLSFYIAQVIFTYRASGDCNGNIACIQDNIKSLMIASWGTLISFILIIIMFFIKYFVDAHDKNE